MKVAAVWFQRRKYLLLLELGPPIRLVGPSQLVYPTFLGTSSLASDARNVHTSTMTLKSAATFAFIGTLVGTLVLTWDFVSDIVYVAEGLVPLAKLLASFVGALVSLS